MPSNTYVIVHFSPLERYPPVMNLIRFLESKDDDHTYIIYSTFQSEENVLFAAKKPDKIKIYRRGYSGSQLSKVRLLLTYFYFNFAVLINLIFKKPSAILYYETLSSFSTLVYKLIFNRKVKVFAHYHEYVSSEDYENGMMQLRFFHSIEQQVYPMMSWLSHTNNTRLRLFLEDNKLNHDYRANLLPNYPPANWSILNRDESISSDAVKKFVLVGSLSLNTMYTKEFAYWVKSMNGNVIWDIYSFNISPEITKFFNDLDCSFIRLFPAVDYFELPKILRKYQIGLILYKGYSPNVIHSVSNKLFEYHVCGLDVWFSDDIVGSKEYINETSYPKILEINFELLNDLDLEKVLDRKSGSFRILPFKSEEVFQTLYSRIIGD